MEKYATLLTATIGHGIRRLTESEAHFFIHTPIHS